MENLSPHLKSFFSLNFENVGLRFFGKQELYDEEYLKWMNDPEITKTIGRFDYLMPVTLADLESYHKNIDRKSNIFFGIYFDGFFIGTLKVYAIDLLSRSAGLGIVIGDRKFWGKGIATKSIRLATQYLFNDLGFRRIHAGFYSNNLGMEKAFLRNNFTIEGILKEHIFFQGNYVDHVLVGKIKK